MQEIHRWLEQHEQNILSDLISLCSIKSVSDSASDVRPFGAGCRQALACALGFGERDGFEVRNYDNYLGRIAWNPNGPEAPAIGIWSHLDVVAEGEGWQSDPYRPEIRDGWLYGRGVADNKNAAVAGLYILRALRDLRVPVRHNIHLYLGTNEESGMEDLAYFTEHDSLPAFSLVPDSGFPGSMGEFGSLRVRFTARKPFSGAVKALEAGTALNIVPDKASASLAVDAGAGNDEVFVDAGNVTAHGVSSHAGYPQDGRNAIMLLAAYLKDLKTLPEEDRAVFRALYRISADCYGKALGIDFTKEGIGSTVFSATLLRLSDGCARVDCDCRFAIGDSADRICSILEKVSAESELNLEVLFRKDASFKDPSRPVMVKMKELYTAFTGKDEAFEISRGGTYAGRMEQAFATGVVLEGEENPALKGQSGHGGMHQPDECIPVDGYLKGIQLLSDMLLAADEII